MLVHAALRGRLVSVSVLNSWMPSTVITCSPQDISSHKFCLAPTGGGHGKRNVLVSLMGCLPVTVTDHVLQPFEPEMPWAPFAVHVPERDIPRMHEILGNISDDKVAEMQVGPTGSRAWVASYADEVTVVVRQTPCCISSRRLSYCA